MTYEEAIHELEEILQALQQQQISIDQLNAQSERAAELIRYCQGKLKDTEERLGQLFNEVV